MSAEEPIYCSQCGAEDFGCDCPDAQAPGPYCDVCGVIPAKGGECMFMKRGGRRDGCEAEVQVTGDEVRT